MKKKISTVFVAAIAAVIMICGPSQVVNAQPYPQNGGSPNVTTFVAGAGWTGYAGTIGENRQLQAIKFATRLKTTSLCMKAYVRGIGWMSEQCSWGGSSATIGVIGRALEAVQIWSPSRNVITAGGHFQNVGWTWLDNAYRTHTVLTFGVAGSGRHMEAFVVNFDG